VTYLGVFATAFLAATLLPISSEVALVAATYAGEVDAAALWCVASIGNTLGAVLNWALGRFALRWSDRRWFPATPAQLERGQAWFARWGVWSLCLAWTPVVGDALTVVAGIARVRLPLFVLLVGAGKAARYAVVLHAVGAFGRT